MQDYHSCCFNFIYFNKIITCIITLCLISLPGMVFPQKVDLSNVVEIYPLHDILKLMEQSELVYEIAVLNTPVFKRQDGRKISNQYFLNTTDNNVELMTYSVSPEAADTILKGENAFQSKQYDMAIKYYKQALELEPGYSQAYTLIGDAYYMLEDYRQSRANFEEAIKRNFIDYQAHWFLADLLWNLGEREQAVHEITIAHILNVNHPDIMNKLKIFRYEIQHPWKEWDFIPQYSMNKEHDKVIIKTDPIWTGYALVKAFWKYEPRYAEYRYGAGYKEQLFCTLEEREAIRALVANNDHFENIEKIIADGFDAEMVFYEIGAPQTPEIMALLPKDMFNRIVEYVNAYH